MFRPLALYIGFRYTRAKRRNHFISFISFISMIGIALGVAVLITVLSVMNGFDYEIHNKIFNMSSHVVINDMSGRLQNWQGLGKQVAKNKDVVASAPFVSGQGMVTNAGTVQGVMVTGILPIEQAKVSNIGNKMIVGKMLSLQSGAFNVVLGDKLAASLGAMIGDKITLVTPKAAMTPVGIVPRFKRFKVTGIFHVGGGFGYFDSGVIFINLEDAQKLFQLGDNVSSLRLKVNDLYVAPKVSHELSKILPERYSVTDWTEQYGAYFKAISMEKTMMFIILLFIIAVAAFNLVSTLVMSVTDKQSDIAILRTLGASPRTIMGVFMVQGLTSGIIGTLIGTIGGILLALNAPAMVAGLEHLFHTQFISADVYFINYLPSRLDWMNVLHVSLSALALSLLATIYPAWRASKTHPAEALRYE